MKRITSTIAIFLCALTSNAQSLEPFSGYGSVSPGAEAYSMTRYGTITPSLYTGAMDYSLSLYTYQDEDFTIPISLDYYFDGMKPAMASGIVGLGWSLNCGGVITRDVMGVADDEWLGYNANQVIGYAHADRVNSTWSAATEHPVSENTDVTTNSSSAIGDITGEEARIEAQYFDPFAGVAVTWSQGSDPTATSGTKYDAVSDVYHFKIGGMTGDFILLEDGSTKVYNTSTPHGEIRVELLKSTSIDVSVPGIAFVLTDGNGYEYTFGGCHDWRDMAKVDYSGSAGESVSRPQITAWKLASIKAPNGKVAEFCYTPYGYPQVNFSKTIYYTPRRASGPEFSNGWNGAPAIETLHGNFSHPLDTVKVNGRAVAVFAYEERPLGYEEDTRTERLYISRIIYGITSRGQIKSKNLKSVTVKNSSNDIVEKADLTYSYSGRRMLLSGLSLLSKGRFGFEYDDSVTLPTYESVQYDHWGYWNGASGYLSDLHSLIPLTRSDAQETSLYNLDSSNIWRNANFNYARRGALNKIVYPTGGRTEIEYEAHSASGRMDRHGYEDPFLTSNPSIFHVGGVRVKSITDKDASGTVTGGEQYTYQKSLFDSTSSGILMNMPLYAVYLDFSYGRTEIMVSGFTNQCTFSQPREGHIGYTNVQEHHRDGSVTEYEFNSYSNCPDEFVYSVSNMNISKKTGHYVNHTTNDDNAIDAAEKYIGISGLPKVDRAALRGKLIRSTVYSAGNRRKMSVRRYSYGLSQAHTRDWYHNTLLSFVKASHTICAPVLNSEADSTYFADGSAVGRIRTYAYNNFGQIVCKTVTSGLEADEFHYFYKHGGLVSDYMALKSDAVKTRIQSGSRYVTGSEHYTYGTGGGGYRPTEIVFYICTPTQYYGSSPSVTTGRTGDSRSSTFTYDPAYRRLLTVTMPGGAILQYSWDSTYDHIVGKTVNGTGNTFSYQWKDLVGLTGLTDPTGRYEAYTYDSRNRLQTIKDRNGRKEMEYDYNTVNE